MEVFTISNLVLLDLSIKRNGESRWIYFGVIADSQVCAMGDPFPNPLTFNLSWMWMSADLAQDSSLSLPPFFHFHEASLLTRVSIRLPSERYTAIGGRQSAR